jgi:mRNA interferase MazF
VVSRGEVWWADLGEPLGSEPGYRRPVLVISSDRFNASRISTVIVAAITSNVRLAAAPGNVRLARRTAGLQKESVVNVTSLLTLDRARLEDRSGAVAPATLREIDDGLRLALAV